MMNKGKIFIGCGGAILLLVLAIVGFVTYIYSDKEYLAQHDAVTIEGKEFGKTTDQNSCIQRGLSWLGEVKNPSIKQVTLNGRFVNECLRSAKPSPNFCKDVPKLIDRKWKKEQCSLVGRDDLTCDVVFDEKRSYCVGL